MTAKTLRTGVLEPTLDAIALNRHQARLVANPTPEVDSLAEHVRELARLATRQQRPHLLAVLELLRTLAASNDAEQTQEQTVAGLVDRMVSEQRDLELNGTSRKSARACSRALRPVLADLLNPMLAAEHPARTRLLHQLVREFGPDVCLSEGVRHSLAGRKARLLENLIGVAA